MTSSTQALTSTAQLPWTSFADFLASRRDGNAPFLSEIHHARGTRQDWEVSRWQQRIDEVGCWLDEQGVRAGDAVATMAGNTGETLAVAFACWKFGYCCVPLNPVDSRHRLALILEDSRAVLVVHSPDLQELAVGIVRSTGTRQVSVSQIGADARSDRVTPRTPQLDEGYPALRVYTSGTTGDAKGVVLTAANLLIDCDGMAQAIDWPADTRIMTVLPVHHVNGLVISSLLPWFLGISTVLSERFSTAFFWTDVEAEGATVCSMVPTLLELLLASPDRPEASSLREVLCGAGPLLVDTVLDFEDAFGIPVRHLYGLSETTAVVSITPRMESRVRRQWHKDHGFPSIGSAIPHAELSIRDSHGNSVDKGVRGEIAVKGPMVMSGYAGHLEATKAAVRNGWFHTGDEGFWQPGPGGVPFYFITSRMKEVIIRGGANLSPLEIDGVLRAHPAVRFALSVPFAHRIFGEEVAAYVVAEREVSEQELILHCARMLDFTHCPKVIIFGEDVPFTSTGKPKRLQLRDQLADQLEEYKDTKFISPINQSPLLQ